MSGRMTRRWKAVLAEPGDGVSIEMSAKRMAVALGSHRSAAAAGPGR